MTTFGHPLKRTWLLLIAALVLSLLLLRPAAHNHSPPQPPASVASQAAVEQPPDPGRAAGPPGTTPTAVPPTATSSPNEEWGSNSARQASLARWQAPIDFYGAVVDEKSNPVPEATIRFQWVETPTEGGTRTSTTESGPDGLFSLRGERGPSLEVWVSKQGYYSSHGGQQGFSYLNGGFSPDPQNPVVFRLHKRGKGESLIGTRFPAGIGQVAQLHHDGTPAEIDLLRGTEAPGAGGHLKLEFWRAITSPNANVFDWKCQLTVPGGGLVETLDEFAFQAPENGYQPSIVLDVAATNQPWTGEIRSKYYIQLPDGKYGRVDLHLLAHNGVFTVQSAVNPTGSRNLEPAN